MPAGEIQTDANAKRKDRSIFVTGTKKGHMVPVVHRFVIKSFFLTITFGELNPIENCLVLVFL